MKVSIITAVRNNHSTIKDAINSVLNQTYKNIEYIIIDGNSTDGTVEIIKSYGEHITNFISEPDNGIYDGLNKGISCSSGEIIGFLHGDDLYADIDIIANVVKAFEFSNTDAIYGDLIYTQKSDTAKILRYWKGCDFDPKLLKYGWMPAHPTFFAKRILYEQYGLFDTSFKIAADYDFMLRVLSQKIKTYYLPIVMYRMRIGGESNKSFKNIIKKSFEDLRALKKNNVGGATTLIFKNTRKILQFLKKS